MSNLSRAMKCYRQRKAHGLCPKCGKSRDREGILCIFCCNQLREARQIRLTTGYCTRCNTPVEGEIKCAHCRRKDVEYNRTRATGCDPQLYADLLEVQNGKCAICLAGPSKKRQLAADHSHEGGYVRGLLCQRCNQMLSLLDNPEAFKRIMRYIK